MVESTCWSGFIISLNRDLLNHRFSSELESLLITEPPNDSEVPLVYSSYQARRRRAAMADPQDPSAHGVYIESAIVNGSSRQRQCRFYDFGYCRLHASILERMTPGQKGKDSSARKGVCARPSCEGSIRGTGKSVRRYSSCRVCLPASGPTQSHPINHPLP